jgi:hypothetical protein
MSIIPDMLQAIVDAFTTKLGEVATYLSGEFTTTVTDLIDGALTDLKVMFIETLYSALESFKVFRLMELKDYIDGDLTTSINKLVDPTLTNLNNYIDGTLSDTVKTFTTPTMSNLTTAFNTLVISINTAIGRLPTLGAQFSAIKNTVDSLTSSIRALIDAINAIPDIPSPKVPEKPAQAVSGRVNAPLMGLGLAGATNMVNLNMGGVGIYNAMDEATFVARVEQAVRRAL